MPDCKISTHCYSCDTTVKPTTAYRVMWLKSRPEFVFTFEEGHSDKKHIDPYAYIVDLYLCDLCTKQLHRGDIKYTNLQYGVVSFYAAINATIKSFVHKHKQELSDRLKTVNIELESLQMFYHQDVDPTFVIANEDQYEVVLDTLRSFFSEKGELDDYHVMSQDALICYYGQDFEKKGVLEAIGYDYTVLQTTWRMKVVDDVIHKHLSCHSYR